MPAADPVPEIPLPVQGRRIRVQRIICLTLLPFLAIPLFLAATGPFAPVDHDAPVAVQSVEGQASYAPSTEADETSSSVKPTTTTTEPTTTSTVVTTTTIVPTVRSAKKPATAPTTEAASPTTADAPATTSVAPAPTTAPRPVVTAPRPAATVPRPVAVAPAPAPTTTTPPPPATTTPPKPTRSQSGQATWYRWRKGNCAHNSLPKGTKVTVTAVASGRTTTCVVGDRGGFRNPTIIDLDASVFEKIAPLGAGRIAVTISW